MKKRRKRRGCISVLIGLSVVLICLLATAGAKPGGDAAYGLASLDVIYTTEDTQGLFLYEETVVFAKEAGSYSGGFALGDQIAAGEVAGELKRLNDIGTEPVKLMVSPKEGVYSEAVDGWESILTPENLTKIDLSRVFTAYQKPEIDESPFVRQGEPCFKVMDNKGEVYLLVDLKTTYITGDTLRLKIKGEETEGSVVFVKKYDDSYFALVRLIAEDPYFLSRQTEVTLILSEKKGVVVSADAITKRFGETGVYTLSRSELIFCPVTVVCSDGSHTMVTGIDAGTCVMLPTKADMGQNRQTSAKCLPLV